MKIPFSVISVTILLVAGLTAMAQSEAEKLGLPGDNLNLYAAMKLFQDSKTLEGFEKSLNDQKSEINNLDLNGDNNTDYIRVTDKVNGKIHTITLNVGVNEHEDQDLAVFFVEKRDNGQILMQLVGDEDLYGKDYILEPSDQTFKETPSPSLSGNKAAAAVQNTAPNAIAAWPLVKFIFLPGYVVWRSPWRWNYYPSYWKPWRPQFWHYYYGYHSHLRSYYNGHFRKWPYFRNPAWYSHYYGGNFRSRSITVRTRQARGDYKVTYSKPTSVREGSSYFLKQHPRTSPPKASSQPAVAPAQNNKTVKPVKTGSSVKKRSKRKPTTRKSPKRKPSARKTPAGTSKSGQGDGQKKS